MSATIDAPRPAHGIPPTGPRPDETARLEDFGGLEIDDMDLSQPLTEAGRERLLAAFAAHPVLVFRGQKLTKDQQYAFTLNFGEIEGAHVNRLIDAKNYTPVHTVSNLDSEGNPSEVLRERGNYYWHSDKSYHAVPSLMTMLHAVELPPKGGETQFANTAKAYAALPEEDKALVAALRAIHSWEASRIQSNSRPATAEQMAERPPVDHPVVRTHPDTGAKVLYLGNHASHIVGWPLEQGQVLMRRLLAHATQAPFVYTHRWRQGDLVLWDNRCSVHRALPHEAMGTHRRVLHRTVVKGTVPL
jgi:alpha-ketoglutarate-dependent taurine dioxygenase